MADKMLKADSNADVEEIVAGIDLAFQRLLGLMKVPVPVITAVSVAIMLGSTNVQILSYEFPIIFAPLASAVLLIGIYVACIKAALTLLRLLQSLIFFNNDSELESQSIVIMSESSVLNPFSSTKVPYESDNSIFDYTGIIMILLPAVFVLITSTWVLYDLNRYMVKVVESAEGTKLEERMEIATSAGNYIMATLYLTAKSIFIVLYGYFLLIIINITGIINSDAHVRRTILILSFTVIVVPVFIFDLIWHMGSLISVVKLISTF